MLTFQNSSPPPRQGEQDVNDKVWFTYKARIQAHQRLSKNDFHSQVILVWYALISALLAIVAIRYPHFLGSDTDIAAAALSVLLLAVLMLVANRDFRGRAISMRSNYLALQGLHSKMSSPPTSVELKIINHCSIQVRITSKWTISIFAFCIEKH